MRQINNACRWVASQDDSLHYAHERVFLAEIGQERHDAAWPQAVSVSCHGLPWFSSVVGCAASIRRGWFGFPPPGEAPGPAHLCVLAPSLAQTRDDILLKPIRCGFQLRQLDRAIVRLNGGSSGVAYTLCAQLAVVIDAGSALAATPEQQAPAVIGIDGAEAAHCASTLDHSTPSLCNTRR